MHVHSHMKLHFVILQFHSSCMIWTAQGILNGKRCVGFIYILLLFHVMLRAAYMFLIMLAFHVTGISRACFVFLLLVLFFLWSLDQWKLDFEFFPDICGCSVLTLLNFVYSEICFHHWFKLYGIFSMASETSITYL